jgi:hypothetical protein
VTTTGSVGTAPGSTMINTSVKWAESLISPAIDTSSLKFYINDVEFDFNNTMPVQKPLPATFNDFGTAPGSLVSNQYVVRIVGNVSGVSTTIFSGILRTQYIWTDATKMSFTAPINELVGSEQALSIAYSGGSMSPYSITGLVMTLNLDPIPVKRTTGVRAPGETYTMWLERFPELGDTSFQGNHEMDSHNNLAEYFYSSHPAESDFHKYPTFNRKDEFLSYTYPVSKTTRGVGEVVLWSSNLVDWLEADVTLESDIDMGDFFLRTARVSYPNVDALDQIFLKLRIVDLESE